MCGATNNGIPSLLSLPLQRPQSITPMTQSVRSVVSNVFFVKSSVADAFNRMHANCTLSPQNDVPLYFKLNEFASVQRRSKGVFYLRFCVFL